jgi:hypothetical protein
MILNYKFIDYGIAEVLRNTISLPEAGEPFSGPRF